MTGTVSVFSSRRPCHTVPLFPSLLLYIVSHDSQLSPRDLWAPPFHKIIPIPYLLTGWHVSSGKIMVTPWLSLGGVSKPHHFAWWPGTPVSPGDSFIKAGSQKSTDPGCMLVQFHIVSAYRLQGTFRWPLTWEIQSKADSTCSRVASVLWSSPSVPLSAFWFS